MATVDIAVQADLALVLPTVVLVEFAQRNQLLLNLASKFHAMPALVDGGSVKCTQPDGQVFVDHDAVVQSLRSDQ